MHYFGQQGCSALLVCGNIWAIKVPPNFFDVKVVFQVCREARISLSESRGRTACQYPLRHQGGSNNVSKGAIVMVYQDDNNHNISYFFLLSTVNSDICLDFYRSYQK